MLDAPATSTRLLVARGFGEFEVDQRLTTTTGGNPDSDDSPTLVPLGYHARPLGERWHAGISITVPSGFGSDYGTTWAGRYHSAEYSLVYVALSPSVSYRINQQISVGLGVGINYTLSESTVAINTLGSGTPDGRLETELDGIGTNVTLAALWQIDADTRAGLIYTSEATADLEGDLEFSNLGPVLGPVLEAQGLLKNDIEIENTLPQRIVAGLYRDLDSGGYLTLDTMWVEFSKFGTSSLSVAGTSIAIDEGGAFEDFWAGFVGYGTPVRDGRRFMIGAFHIESPAKESKRGLALALDRMWGIGAGIEFHRAGGRIDLDLNLVDHGEAPVDTGPALFRGRVVGRTDNPYAVVLDVAYHF